MSAMTSIEGDGVSRDITARPPCGHAKQFSIGKHVRVCAHVNGQSFQGDVFSREICTDAGALEWEIVLQQRRAPLAFGAIGRPGNDDLADGPKTDPKST